MKMSISVPNRLYVLSLDFNPTDFDQRRERIAQTRRIQLGIYDGENIARSNGHNPIGDRPKQRPPPLDVP
jgi:hypothetical protein